MTKVQQCLTQEQYDLLDHGVLRCAICGKKMGLKNALYLGNGVWRHVNHRKSTILKGGGYKCLSARQGQES